MNDCEFYRDAPLYQVLKNYIARGMSSFHTPGHKNSPRSLPLDISFDLTELPDTDSLFECNGAIRQSELRAAELFGAQYTAVSAGGCTLAIQGMLAAFTNIGDTVIFSRNIHRSAINTAILLGLNTKWIMHRNDCGGGLTGRIHPEDVRSTLRRNPGAAAVYVTSPDYYGCMSDIGGIAKVCREFDVPLLVDNAHGTHLIAFDKHPVQLGASASACSAHKTLPVITGGAWLNCNDIRVVTKIKSAMALFGSTSPSYPTMVSLDIARAWMQSEGIAKFRELAEVVSDLRKCAVRAGFKLPSGECDPVRLTLLTRSNGMSGNEAAEYFRSRDVECEHSDRAAVVFILTPFNTEQDIERLKSAIVDFPAKTGDFCGTKGLEFTRFPKCAMPPREVLSREREFIAAAKSVGRIAAEAACPCPPGVPVIMPGEIIDAQCVKILLNTGINQINVLK